MAVVYRGLRNSPAKPGTAELTIVLNGLYTVSLPWTHSGTIENPEGYLFATNDDGRLGLVNSTDVTYVCQKPAPGGSASNVYQSS